MRKILGFILLLFLSFSAVGQWQQVNLPVTGDIILSIYAYDNTILAVVRDASFKRQIRYSIDKGQTWNTATGLGTNVSGLYAKIAHIGNTLYFASSYYNGTHTDQGLATYTSNDNGQTWSLKSEVLQTIGLGPIGIRQLITDGSNLYIPSFYPGMGRSTDGGLTWQALGCFGCPGGVGGLSVALSGSNIVVATSGNIHYSTDNGQSFVNDLTSPYLIKLLEYNGKILGFASEQVEMNGEYKTLLYESSDNGINWTLKTNTNLPANEAFFSPAILKEGNKIFVGLEKGAFLSRTGGDNFIAINEGMPVNASITEFSYANGYIWALSNKSVTSLYYRPLSDFDEVFVSANGNDSNEGKDMGTPKKTIQSAINNSKPDGLVTIISGYFDEEITVPKSVVLQGVNNPIIKNLALKNNSTIAITSPLTLAGLLKIEQGTIFSNGNLILGSNANGTAIVDDSGGKIEGEVKVQRYLGDYAARTTVNGYSYFSVPVSGAKISDFNDNVPIVLNPNYDFFSPYSGAFPNFFRYNESKLSNADLFEKGWESPASLNEPLEVGRGYICNLNTQTTVDFKGTLNNGEIKINLSKGNGTNSGWQLIGNPYPSPLDWEKVHDLASNKDFLEDYTYRRIAIAPYAGMWAYYKAGVGGLNGATQAIAMGQGFFVKIKDTKPTGNYELTFNNGMRIYNGNPQFFRTEESEESKTQGVVKVKLTSGKWSDETMIYFKREASEKYDEGLEVPKYQLNSNPAPNLYTSVAGKKVAFNAQSIENPPKEIPLHFIAASNGQHEISLSELRNFKENTPIYLEDRRLNRVQDLREKAYTFSANVGTDTARFVLKFEVAFATEIPDESLTIYPNPTSNELKINIDSKFRGKLQIRLLDLLGREVSKQSFDKTFTQEEFKMDSGGLNKGVYFVEIEDGRGKQVRKIVKE